jgi:hypothetical protein
MQEQDNQEVFLSPSRSWTEVCQLILANVDRITTERLFGESASNDDCVVVLRCFDVDVGNGDGSV